MKYSEERMTRRNWWVLLEGVDWSNLEGGLSTESNNRSKYCREERRRTKKIQYADGFDDGENYRELKDATQERTARRGQFS